LLGVDEAQLLAKFKFLMICNIFPIVFEEAGRSSRLLLLLDLL
jgi:hypothetical protein